MEQSEFAGLFVERPQAFSWFLGAGASRTAGLPTATDVLWDMKRRYYCREENQDISRQDLQSVAVQNRIQSFMESRGFPKQWEDREYERYFELIFGEDKERQRAYLHGILSQDPGGLGAGNRVIGALIAAGLTRIVFTTNFDDVVERSVAEVGGKAITAFHLEGSHNIQAAWNNEEFPIYCKLHGDFRYDSLKNLAADLKFQNAALAACVRNAGNRFGLVVAGYSGRDKSVMDLLNAVLDAPNPFPHGLFWMELKGFSIGPSVVSLLARAKERGVKAHHVSIETFDAVMLRLWRNLSGKPLDLDQKVRKAAALPVKIDLPPVGTAKPIIRMNALPLVALPDKCQAVLSSKDVSWQDLKEIRAKSNGRLIMAKADKVLCWGAEADIRSSFGHDLKSIQEYTIPQDLNAPNNLVIKSLVEEALGAALVRGKGLVTRTKRSGTYAIVGSHSDHPAKLDPLFHVVGRPTGIVAGLVAPADDIHPAERVTWAESVKLSIEQKAGRSYLVFEPDLWVWPTRARKLAVDFLDQRRADRLNEKYNALIDAWARILLSTADRNRTTTASAFDAGLEVENPRFGIGSRTAFSRRLAV
ncbi:MULTISPECIES: SIR2 family protein [unclassified Bradyrhizobium]|uniref:SIR2 family protein n=1 Tax=unclassified Bradyrhizobium TaxID=2631580 RepID=UPI0029168A6B|nr:MULTISPECIES: SIR2 family protein [unclassified Bradyrhizobium]